MISAGIGFPLGIIAVFPTAGAGLTVVIRASTGLLRPPAPEWWIGLLLLIILGGYLGLVPLAACAQSGDCTWQSRMHHLLLLATVSAIGGWIGFAHLAL